MHSIFFAFPCSLEWFLEAFFFQFLKIVIQYLMRICTSLTPIILMALRLKKCNAKLVKEIQRLNSSVMKSVISLKQMNLHRPYFWFCISNDPHFFVLFFIFTKYQFIRWCISQISSESFVVPSSEDPEACRIRWKNFLSNPDAEIFACLLCLIKICPTHTHCVMINFRMFSVTNKDKISNSEKSKEMNSMMDFSGCVFFL